jgi:iron complex outermembrane receptor protein
MSKRFFWLLSSAALTSLLTIGGALAQTAPPTTAGDPDHTVGEVLVTANKRTEQLKDVAMSVAALTGAKLAATQTLDLEDLSTSVAGLSFEQGDVNNAGAGSRIILRGLNTGGSGATVASVLDDVPLSLSGSNTQGADFATDIDSYDLSQIEVLRGPQGTLYGATAEGGLIKYVSNAPDPGGYHAGFEVGTLGLAHSDGVGASGKGFVNLPLLDGRAAVRAVGFYEETPGWIGNDINGQKGVNSYRRYGGRLSFLWRPTSDLTVRATAFAQTLHGDGYDEVQVAGISNPSAPHQFLNGYSYGAYLPQPYTKQTQLYSLNIEYDMHWARIQSITSYGRLNDGSDTDTAYYANLFAPNTTLSFLSSLDMNKTSQEFRLASEPGNNLFGHALEWQGGFFYTSEPASTVANYFTRAYPSGPFSPTSANVLTTELSAYYEETASYLDATYHFTPQFDVEAGGRIFSNAQHATYTEGGAFLGFPVISLPREASAQTSGTYSIAPRWHFTPDAMVYARIATGYRPGGPEAPIPGGPAGLPISFGSDSTVNYEVGLKAELFDKTVSIDADAYYIDWSKVQVTVVVPVGGVGYNETENAGSAVSKGVEWNLNWSPLRGLNLGVVGAYTDANLTANAPGINAVKGDALPYVPDLTSSFSVNYEHNLFDDYKAFVGGSLSYVGVRYSGFELYYPSWNHAEIPVYETLALQAGVHFKQYTLEIYGKNITDARGETFYSPGGGGPALATGYEGLIRPRTIGVLFTGTF